MKKVVLYQLNFGDPNIYRGSYLMKFPFDRSAYNKVYEYERDDNYCTAENAFYEFNTDLPKDFTGRSMSVSDIVAIDGNEYFCDSVGWKKVINGALVNIEEEKQ